MKMEVFKDMTQQEYKKNRIYALSGSIGGIFFMAGDCLLYCKAGLSNSTVEPLWAEMSEQRFIISAVLGFIGMSLMLPACISSILIMLLKRPIASLSTGSIISRRIASR